jgi:hypothetical protein
MKLRLFKRVSPIFFLPSSIAGILIFLMAMVYSVYSFIEIDKRSHSVSDTLMNFVFRLFIIWTVYSLIAYFTSSNSHDQEHPDEKVL